MRHTSTAATIRALPAFKMNGISVAGMFPEYPDSLCRSVRIEHRRSRKWGESSQSFDEATAPGVLLLVMRKFLPLLAFALPLCAEVKLTEDG